MLMNYIQRYSMNLAQITRYKTNCYTFICHDNDLSLFSLKIYIRLWVENGTQFWYPQILQDEISFENMLLMFFESVAKKFQSFPICS